MEWNAVAVIAEMSDEELIGQLLCYEISSKETPEAFESYAKRTKPGALFMCSVDQERIKTFTDIANKYSPVPVIISSDVENGPGCALLGEKLLPNEMAWGACDEEELIEKAGEVTAQIGRKAGIHWTFSPVMDINYNPNNPVVNVRAISDSPKQVAKIATAYIRGSQKNGMMMTTCKHFPGDGVDDRNQHFCTSINTMSKQEWMDSFGYVYKEAIKSDVAAFMSAHIALPAYEGSYDEIKGYLPATLSKTLQMDLLKNELNFKGVIVSDALSMIGISAMIERKKLAVEFIRTGGDMLLFALPEDADYVKEALDNGVITRERLEDAVKRILELKNKARLFEDQQKVTEEICQAYTVEEIADEIGEKSIKIIRNSEKLLPLKLKKGVKILLVNLQKKVDDGFAYVRGMETLDLELRKRGFETTVLINPGHEEINRIKKEYACILINCKISCQDFPGGSLRMGFDQMMAFWRGYVLEHPCVIFTAFGDPYKIYEVPFVKTYINTFSSSESTQKGMVKVLLGEIPERAKNPVGFQNFFQCEV